MSLNLNKIIIAGRIVREPEQKMTNSGKPVTNFTVAVDRPKVKDQTEAVTDFIDCVAWDKHAQHVSNYFHKGMAICVEGSVQTRKYEKDGQTRVAWSLKTDSVYFVESKGNNTAQTASASPEANLPPQAKFEELSDDSDIPF